MSGRICKHCIDVWKYIIILWVTYIVAVEEGDPRQPFIGFIKDDPSILEEFKSSFKWYQSDIYCCGDGIVGYNSRFDQVEACGKDNDMLCITLNLDQRRIYSRSIHRYQRGKSSPCCYDS